MGAVYRATNRKFKRRVAVKVVQNELVNAWALLERFEREAQLLARLKHPNIVAIYDFGRASEEAFFIVMEHLEGRSLRQELTERGRLALGRVMAIGGQVCGAV